MSHTPGPWHYAEPNKSHQRPMVWRDSDGYLIADCSGATVVGYDEAKANARLIAAAPDLLAACRALCAAYDNGEAIGGEMAWEQVDDSWALAKDAIAKAEGSPGRD